MKRIGFKMKLNPGCAAEYKKRHDEIWPELRDLLSAHGVRDYTIFHDPETNILFAINYEVEGSPINDLDAESGDEEVVRAHGRHHGHQSRWVADDEATCRSLSHGLTARRRTTSRRKGASWTSANSGTASLSLPP